MKHKAKPSGSSGGSRLRLIILAATVAAFLLVPAAQAVAAPEFTVDIEGSGSGTVTGTAGEAAGAETIYPINCSGPPPTGECSAALGPEGLAFFVTIEATADPGSEFVEWTSVGGIVENCSTEPFCTIIVFEGEEATVTAHFASTGPVGPELTVTKEGSGAGTVVSSPAGIECGGTCSAAFAENTEVTLTASPAAGSVFTSWKKCDTGKVEGRKCTVKMSVAKTVGAKFSPTYDITVKKATANTGLGSVTGAGSCDPSCASTTVAIVEGKTATLKPKPYKGSEFTGWTGCPEVVEVVNCKVSSAATVEAKFAEIAKFKLTVNKFGAGTGTVKTKPASINCGLTCSTSASLFYSGTLVELTASVTALKGSTFTGFKEGTGSASSCTTSPCIFTITANSSVTAKFE